MYILDPVEVTVYTIRGEFVKQVFEGRQARGMLSLEWTGTDADGNPVSPGIYFVVAQEGERTATGKVVLQR